MLVNICITLNIEPSYINRNPQTQNLNTQKWCLSLSLSLAVVCPLVSFILHNTRTFVLILVLYTSRCIVLVSDAALQETEETEDKVTHFR